MPEIEIQHVVTFSSADKSNPAENLLKSEGSHKWRSATAGEKSLSCVLQFTKCSQIHSIDIGNEGSAFVEVLVGKAAATDDKDFEVLLVASSFMSPLDSRNGTNRTSVRMFGPEKLNKTTACQMWDRVKIVCTQPFAKTSQYGLSFIKFHSQSEAKDTESKPKKLGAFTIKAASDDDEDIQVGSLFANRGKPDTIPSPTGAAAIRAAGRLAEEHIKATASSSSTSPKTTPALRGSPLPAKRQAVSQASSEVLKKAKTTASKRKNSEDADGSDTEEEVEKSVKPPLRKQSSSVSSTASSKKGESKETPSTLKRNRTEPTSASPARSFSRLMEGVVFVLSGFQNPFRGELRDKAMEMGAKYRPDWGKGCTHLICAFQNTPKYQQVSGKGKIVTKSWISDSHKMKKLLPWRKYRLGDAESPNESTDEDEEKVKPAPNPRGPPEKKASVDTSKKDQSIPPSRKEAMGPSRSSLPKKGVTFNSDSASGSDSEENTDDELRKAADRRQNKKLEGEHKKAAVNQNKKASRDDEDSRREKDEDPYDIATDEELEAEKKDAAATEGGGSDSGLPDLPDFFANKHFFFYGDFIGAVRRQLTRYVAAYDGEEEDYMSKRVNYVVTEQKWDNNFDQALSENPGLIFVKPKWIFLCHKKNALVPYQPFIVVPQ